MNTESKMQVARNTITGLYFNTLNGYGDFTGTEAEALPLDDVKAAAVRYTFKNVEFVPITMKYAAYTMRDRSIIVVGLCAGNYVHTRGDLREVGINIEDVVETDVVSLGIARRLTPPAAFRFTK